MTTQQTYDDVFFEKGPLGLETPRFIKYQDNGQGGSRPVEVASPLGGGIGFLREYVSGKQDYSQESKNIPNFPNFRFQNRYAQESGGPLTGETLISSSPSFDLTRDIDHPIVDRWIEENMKRNPNMRMPTYEEVLKRIPAIRARYGIKGV